MKCETLFVGDGVVAIVCGRRQSRKRCSCGELTNLLCDYPIGEKGEPKSPRLNDARTNIHNRKVFYVQAVDVEQRLVTVHTSPARGGLAARVSPSAIVMNWTTWFERTRPSCDRPVCHRCVVRSGTLDFCAAHGRELDRQKKSSDP